MKTYKTIDLLYGGYNGKIFKNNFKNIKTGEIIEQGKYPRLECFYFIETGKNIFENIDDNFKTDSLRQLLNQKWEEMPQPVSFIEAINKALEDNSKLKNTIWIDEPVTLKRVFNLFAQKCESGEEGRRLVKSWIAGRWIVKEDEE